MRRSLIALPFVLASALVLAGCAGDAPAEPEQTAETAADICATESGAASDALTVSGDFGAVPTVEFDAPLEVDTTQREVVVEGETVEVGTEVTAAYALYNGTTGELIESLGWAEGEAPTSFRADLTSLQEGFARTLACLGPGSRAVGVIPMSEGFGDQASQVGLGEDDVLIFVVDVISAVVPVVPVAWTTDVPEVGGTDDAPTVTLPDAAPKTDLEIAVLKQGDGDVVGAADSVSVHYLGTAWETGEVFDQSYARGEPATFSVQGVVAGFRDALIGQKVGTRLLVTMPPSLGYGASEGHELQNSTLVFLIDIVAIAG